MSYYLEREDVRVVLCYMEAIRDPVGLKEVARLACVMKKPVFVLKAGTSEAGQRAAAAHTGALAASDAICDAAFRQWGLVRASTFDVLIAAGALASRFDAPTQGRFGVYAQGGGMSVMTSDMFSDRGLHLPNLEPSTTRHLKELLADTTPGNPFDSGGQFLSSGVELLVEALNSFAEDASFNFLVYCLMPVAGLRSKVYAEGIARAAQTSRKPGIVLQYGAGEITEEASRVLRGAGLLVLDPPDAAIDALPLWLASAIVTNAAKPPNDSVRVDESRAMSARAMVNDWKQHGVVTASQWASQPLIDLYGIPHSRQSLARTVEEAVDVVTDFGTPVAMKIESADLPHRSDFGGVILNVIGPESTRDAFELLLQRASAVNPQARVSGVLIAEMAKSGIELVAGINVDQTLGPAVVVGMGGVMAEIFSDVSIRLPPIDDFLADEMLRALKGSALLFGHRGTSGVDIPALRRLLVRLGEVATDLDRSVRAIDLNPLVVYPPDHGLEVLDVLVEMAS
jgi:acyl-CoA synthetase (NDP forming)